jgi:hypothetical protein
MPQHLEIKFGGESKAKMKTSHLNGTHYDIYWNHESGFHIKFFDIDTGVKCQPKDKSKSKVDFKNDFIHMRRAIAAASKTASLFLYEFGKISKITPRELENVEINFHTNHYNRGVVYINPDKSGKAMLQINVGTGPTRPLNAEPPDVETFFLEEIDISEASDSLSMAIHVLESQSHWMLEELSKGS